MEERWIDIAKRFTDVYRENAGAHKALREVRCLNELFPAMLFPLQECDLFAGGIGWFQGKHIPVDFNPHKDSQIGYGMNVWTLRELQKAYPARAGEIESLIAFWRTESTFVKIRETAPPDIKDYLYACGRATLDDEGYFRVGRPDWAKGTGFVSGSFDCRIAGFMPDFDKLVRLGIPGLRNEVARCAAQNTDAGDFYAACAMALDIACNTMRHYRAQALSLAQSTEDDAVRRRMTACAAALEVLPERAPQTFYESVQLVALFVILCRVVDYGRLDVCFGDLLAHDLDAGVIDEDEAVTLTAALWDFFNINGFDSDTRVLIGGAGRRNPENADRFAMIAMEATRRLHKVMPVLTLRVQPSDDPTLLDKAIECIGEGCIYPTLYNDEVYIPGLMKIMHLPREDAEQYAPLGCGEILVATMGSGSPNSTMRFLKALEAALHNGRDGTDGVPIGPQTGEVTEFATYEQLEAALFAQIRAALEKDVKIHLWNRKVAAEEMSFVFPSLLMADCLERGKGLLDGGLRYFGANTEGFGMTNVADSLAVIKKMVYEEKRYTLPQLVKILDADFEGYEEDRQAFLNVVKYGNNDEYVDAIKRRVEEYANAVADEIGRANGFSWFTIANVNPGGITIGPSIAASADGRHCGEPMALGNSPMPGMDVSGITSMLLSSAKTSPENGGCVTNMNLSRETITHSPEKFRHVVETYFREGGLQLNINCFSRGDLEKALQHPEQYPHLIVRVSGYSARFIDLDPITQKHIMDRTLY